MSFSIPFSSIIEGQRGRNAKKYGDLEGLKASLASIGSIHPITLAKEGDKYRLVAGGRRYRAMSEMGVTELWHHSVLDPTRLGFLYADEVPADVQAEAELDENLHRLDVDWIDNVVMIDNVHTLKKKTNLKWGLRQTAALLGPGYGLSNVQYATTVAKFLRKGDKEILECKDLKAAIGVLLKRKEDDALAELQRRAAAKIGSTSAAILVPTGGTSSFLDKMHETLGSKLHPSLADQLASLGVPQESISIQPTSQPQESTPPVVIPLSSMFFYGDCIKKEYPKDLTEEQRQRFNTEIMASFPDSSFNHIVTDIPYAIDMDNLTVKGKADVVDQHQVEDNIDLMEPFLRHSFRLVKPGGFCVFFMDQDHWNYLQRTAKDIGWKVQDWPLIWHKTHNCRNGAPGYNYTKNYESAMVLRRDESSVLRKSGPLALWSGEGSSERRLYSNPFAKPFALWKEMIYDNIAFPGQSVYDPFCGEMSACRAAANCGLVPYGSEINETHYNRGMEHMRKVYALIHKSNCSFA